MSSFATFSYQRSNDPDIYNGGSPDRIRLSSHAKVIEIFNTNFNVDIAGVEFFVLEWSV